MATSPLLSFEGWASKRVLAGSAAPAKPMPFRNERRLTTRCQSKLMPPPADGEIFRKRY